MKVLLYIAVFEAFVLFAALIAALLTSFEEAFDIELLLIVHGIVIACSLFAFGVVYILEKLD